MSFETGSNPQVNSSNLLCATYATFLAYLKDAINIPSVRWYFHWLETRLTDGLFAWKKGSLGDGELNNCIHNYSKTKTERKKCKKMQTILHGGCYLLFEGYLQEKKYRFLSWVRPCRRIGLSFEESHGEVRLLRTRKIFEKQLLNSTIVWCKELCWFRRLLLIHLGWSSSLIWTIIHIIPSFIRLRDQEELAEKWIASPLKLF